MPSVVTRTAPPGVGKSLFGGVVQLVDEVLPETDEVFYTNVPIDADKCAEYAAKVHRGDAEEYKSRIKVIPDDMLLRWMPGSSQPAGNDGTTTRTAYWEGPWDNPDFFDRPGLIVLDEAHLIIPDKGATNEHRIRWGKFLSEIRHRKLRIEFISQNVAAIAREIHLRSEYRIRLASRHLEREPLLGIRMGDWYELVACFTGTYYSHIWEIEEHLEGSRWKQLRKRTLVNHPRYWALYDSYSVPVEEAIEKGRGEVEDDAAKAEREKKKNAIYQYQKRSKLGLVLWFFFRNVDQFIVRGAVLFFGIWFLAFGGYNSVSKAYVAAWTGTGIIDSPEPPVADAYRGAPVPQRTDRTTQTIVGLTDRGVLMSDGREVPAGESMSVTGEPEYEILDIDVRRRRVSVVGGRWLSLGSDLVPESELRIAEAVRPSLRPIPDPRFRRGVGDTDAAGDFGRE